ARFRRTYLIFFFQAEDGIRDGHVTGVQTCALPISLMRPREPGVGMSGIWPLLTSLARWPSTYPEIRAASGRYTIRSASDRIADWTLVAAHSRADAGLSAPKDSRSSVALARMSATAW